MMKKIFLSIGVLFATLTLHSCASSPIAPESEEVYQFKGLLIATDRDGSGAPMPNISVTINKENRYNTDKPWRISITTKTDEAGIFSFPVKRNEKGKIKISNELLLTELISFKGPADSTPDTYGQEIFSLVGGEGAERYFDSARPGNVVTVSVYYNNRGNAFSEIKRLYEKDKNYKEVINKAKTFIVTSKNDNNVYTEEIRQIAVDAEKSLQEEMVSKFKDLIILNEKGDFISVISKGKNYIEEYRNIKGSQQEEVEKFILQAENLKAAKEAQERMLSEFKSLITSNKKGDFGYVVSNGKNYIEKYSSIKDSRWEEIEKLVSIADKEEQRRLAETKKQIELEEQEKRIAEEKVEKEHKKVLSMCNGEIIDSVQDYTRINPYADKGKCVHLLAILFQYASANTGLFKVTDNLSDLVLIEFKKPFRGNFVQGIAKIKGTHSYITNNGGTNTVPSLKMLKIERIQ